MTRVLVTGATGFTGSSVVPLLLAKGYRVRCFVRPTSDRRWLPQSKIEWAVGDLSDVPSLSMAMRGVEILVNVASLGFGHAPAILEATQMSRITRAVFVSTTAVLTTLDAKSKETRLAAERLILDSGLAFTILRPTMIYGGSRDRNISRLVSFLRASPIIPVFGSGKHMQQPVHVSDIATALVTCIDCASTIGRTYVVAGPEPISYNEVIDTVAAAIGRQVIKVHLPATPIVSVLALGEALGMRFPIRREQVKRLEEHKAFDIEAAHADFGYSPKSFAEGVALEINEMTRSA